MWWNRRQWEGERARRLQESAVTQELMQAFIAAYPDDLPAAKQALDEMLVRCPHDLFARNFASAGYLALGEKEKAITQLAVILALDPTFYVAQHSLAELLREQGDTATATRVLEAGWQHAKKSCPRSQQEARRREFFGEPQGEKPERRWRFPKISRPGLPLPSNTIKLDYGDSVVFINPHPTRGVLRHYEKAIRANPSDPELRLHYGHALSQARKHTEAIEQFREAIRLKPEDEGAHCSLGIQLKEIGDLDDAIAEFHEALRLISDENPVCAKQSEAMNRWCLSGALREKGQKEEARKELLKAIDLARRGPSRQFEKQLEEELRRHFSG